MMANRIKTFFTTTTLLFASQLSMAEEVPFTLQTQQKGSYSTKIIIQSKTDGLLINDIQVNRGQCSIEVTAAPVEGRGKSYMDAINDLKVNYHEKARKALGAFYDEKIANQDLERAVNIFEGRRELKFSQAFTPIATCSPNEILEISIDTNQGSWKFGQ